MHRRSSSGVEQTWLVTALSFVAALLTCAALAACSDAATSRPSAASAPAMAVWADATLSAALPQIAAAFEQREHTKLGLRFAPASELATAIAAGQAADVFVARDPEAVQRLGRAGQLVKGSRRHVLDRRAGRREDVVHYHAAILRSTASEERSRSFIAFLSSPEVRAILDAHGLVAASEPAHAPGQGKDRLTRPVSEVAPAAPVPASAAPL